MSVTKADEIAYRGYDEVTSLFVPNETLHSVIDRINKFERIDKKYGISRMSKREALKDTKIFYASNLKLHKVLTAKDINLMRFHTTFIRKVDPFSLPVEYIKDIDAFAGSVVERFLPTEKPTISFRKIILCYPTNEHTSTSYAHEIMHTQTDSIHGCIKDFYNAEVLSIFIELVITYYISKDEYLINLEDSRRAIELLISLEELLEYIKVHGPSIDLTTDDVACYDANKSITDNHSASELVQLLEDTKYFVSSLKAYDLFNTFYFGSDAVKKELISSIQSVIDGNETLEDYLARFDVTLESSQDEKRLIKYFGR